MIPEMLSQASLKLGHTSYAPKQGPWKQIQALIDDEINAEAVESCASYRESSLCRRLLQSRHLQS